MFESAILVEDHSPRRRWTMPVSLFAQATLVLTVVIIPLVFTEQLGVVPLRAMFTLPIRLAPTPPPAAAQRTASTVSTQSPKVFIAPDPGLRAYNRIPSVTPAIVDTFDGPPVVGTGVPGNYPGVEGGLPINGVPLPPAAKPRVEQASKPKAPTGPVQVGGEVNPPLLIRQIQPIYPPLARAARIEGVVRISAILTREGGIRSLQVVSGHPLLVRAAVDAVQQWIYRPTLLNGQPVEVAVQIDVRFLLSQR